MGAPPGERHGRSKLTENDVKWIRDIYATGKISHFDLAMEFELVPSTIGCIVNRKTWKHV